MQLSSVLSLSLVDDEYFTFKGNGRYRRGLNRRQYLRLRLNTRIVGIGIDIFQDFRAIGMLFFLMLCQLVLPEETFGTELTLVRKIFGMHGGFVDL